MNEALESPQRPKDGWLYCRECSSHKPPSDFSDSAVEHHRQQCRRCATKARKHQRAESAGARKRQAVEHTVVAAQSQLSGLGSETHQLVVVVVNDDDCDNQAAADDDASQSRGSARQLTVTSAEAAQFRSSAVLLPPQREPLPEPRSVEQLLANLHAVTQVTTRVPEPYRKALESAMNRGRHKPVVAMASNKKEQHRTADQPNSAVAGENE